MPLAQTPPDGHPSGSLRVLWPVIVGPLAILSLAFTGVAEPGPAVLASAVTAVAGFMMLRRLGRALDSPASGAAQSLAAAEDAPPFAAILDRLPDPLMVIAAEEADDLTGRRFLFANAAARELFKIQPQGGLLVTAVRNPRVLEAVDEALFGGVEGVAEFETGGTQGRSWLAHARPLRETGGRSRLAVLALRDETDARRSERTRADFLANASH